MAKKTKEEKVKKSEVTVIESAPVTPTKTRLQELQELYAILLKEGITSISKLEAIISQLQK